MKYKFTRPRKIATALLILWSYNMLSPAVCYALTSGPVQPETKGFQPAGVSDMVDLQTGDFKYNIPLLDIDGYPINLNYQSGVGMDDEASWVGLGWSLNPGAINRQLRGVPDDMAGDDVVTEHYTRPKVTIGGTVTFKTSFWGNGLVEGSFTAGVFNDNYTGIGAQVGANAGMSFSLANDGALTAGLGTGVTSNTSSGVDLSPYVNLSLKNQVNDNMTTSAGLSASLGYNTRSGMKNLTLGSSFGVTGVKKDQYYINATDPISAPLNITVSVEKGGSGSANYSIGGGTISYNTEPINPRITVPYQTHYGSFSLDGGGSVLGTYIAGGITGYKSVREVIDLQHTNHAYGFLYAERGKYQQDAVMDFTREKENPIIKDLPNLALPVQTPDLFTYTSQGGSGQFRLYRGGTGAFFDSEAQDVSNVTTLGIELGFGLYFHGSADLFRQSTTNTTRKWAGNAYLKKGDFQNSSTVNPGADHVYFKQVGEKNVDDPAITNLLYGTRPLAVNVSERLINSADRPEAYASFRDSTSSTLPAYPIVKNTRQLKRTVISYLTAKEADAAALEKKIISYPVNDSSVFHASTPLAKPVADPTIDRVSGVRKEHHISEITVTDDGGKRSVYGIPVYNLKQEEYSFAIGAAGYDYSIVPGSYNQVSFNPSGQLGYYKGIDYYYHKDSQPAYATSYLLTAILSPDYVDKTGDGISDDDLGTAIKFNYSKLPYIYKWRTPYQNATLNRSLLADADDDKASIVYGEKEIWYVHSIESKTKIAYFITKDRQDGLGVNDWTGGQDATHKQKCLTEIRLYSKADMTRPIKVVRFEYKYELCPGIPNSLAGGKLTLAKVYFTYGNSDKGKNHPYIFDYSQVVSGTAPVHYSNMSTDRWGTYKSPTINQSTPFDLQNDEFPYTVQRRDTTDKAAALWHLNQIKLPTGGVINVTYESGDYAYVQDKKAMAMSQVLALVNTSGGVVDQDHLANASGIRVAIDGNLKPPTGADQKAWFKRYYLSGSDHIYTKLYIRVATNLSNPKGQEWDFLPCYAEINSVHFNSDNTADVIFTDRTDSDNRGTVTANPIVMAAWQKMKEEYPRYAYPGFDTRDPNGNILKSVVATVTAIANAFGNLRELQQNFYQKAKNRGYANQVQLGKSMVRLTKTDGFKLGGGTRVKKIQISDSWNTMSGSGSAAAYGQAYDYTTVEDGKIISSGVAAYEPSVGNDENPLKQPVTYTEHRAGGLDNYYDMEKPFGESFFPAPTVAYSKVTVRDLNKSGQADAFPQTGYIVNEFYTAKDFPVQVHVLPIKAPENAPHQTYNMFETNSIDELWMSQGYSIELNDMHGKPKATRVFNQSGSEISSTEYSYNATPINGNEFKLKNVVNVIKPDGTIDPNRVIGRDIEFYTDFREQETVNDGHTYNAGINMIPGIFFLPMGFLQNPINSNYEYKLFRSACAVKVVQYFGIIDKVIKKQNGSTITTENIAYDGLTGEALITRTQNEFDKDIYSVNLPAYWVYNGMSGAYQNQGVLMSGFTTDSNGKITGSYQSYLHGGDEIADIETGTPYWVIDNESSANTKKLITRSGTLVKGYTPTGYVKIIRSGYRNMLGAGTSSIVSLNNPIVSGHLQITAGTDLTAMQVINASASTFDESWNVNKVCQQNTALTEQGMEALAHYSNNVPVTAKIQTTPGGTPSNYSSTFWSNSVNRAGIQLLTDNGYDTHYAGFGFEKCIDVDATKTYYLGFWTSGAAKIKIDGAIVTTTTSGSLGAYWTVIPVTSYLSSGSHHQLYVENIDNALYAGLISLEIYQNSGTDLTGSADNGSNLNVLFSTATLSGHTDVQQFLIDYSTFNHHYHYLNAYGNPPDVCGGLGVVNPYVQGYLGNWRPYQTLVYQQSRNYNDIFNPAKKGIEVSKAGYINSFYSYWKYNSGWVPNTSATRWVTANTVTQYDKYGQQLENRDALNRYSAAKFDFNGELPSAVASNAMNREIYAAAFEDTKFMPGDTTADTCNVHDFIGTISHAGIKTMVNANLSHTGNYAVTLPAGGITLSTLVHSRLQKTLTPLTLDASKQYITRDSTGLYPNGFEPYPGKKYIFNAWVKDSDPHLPVLHVSLKANAVDIPLKCKAIVEGWKLVEGTIDLAAIGATTGLNIALAPTSGTIYVDDIRIHPFDAHMKTYAYDDKTLRLMAELDENGFATFYEYDDEGLLVRVKKETERGVMTLKESRSSYKKATP